MAPRRSRAISPATILNPEAGCRKTGVNRRAGRPVVVPVPGARAQVQRGRGAGPPCPTAAKTGLLKRRLREMWTQDVDAFLQCLSFGGRLGQEGDQLLVDSKSGRSVEKRDFTQGAKVSGQGVFRFEQEIALLDLVSNGRRGHHSAAGGTGGSLSRLARRDVEFHDSNIWMLHCGSSPRAGSLGAVNRCPFPNQQYTLSGGPPGVYGWSGWLRRVRQVEPV